MSRRKLALSTLLVKEYDPAIAFFTKVLGMDLITDEPQGHGQDGGQKRWVAVAPKGHNGSGLLLARADTPAQTNAIGQQTGGRVAFFLETEDFWRDYKAMAEHGVEFPRDEPREEPYGTVVVFQDISGNLWDLIQYAD